MRALLFVLVILVGPLAAAQAPAAGRQIPQPLDRGGIVLGYLLYLPDGYDEGAEWPLVLFLHGSGERGDSLDLVALHGPPRLVREGHAFPFILASPQQPLGGRWSADTLTVLLDDLMERYHVNEDRIYVTGLSMGGQGTYRLAEATPERFAAIAPVCGRISPGDSERLRNLPTWIFHGMRDDVVPPQLSIDKFEAIRAAGNEEVGLTLYPDANHDSWTRTYENPDVYDWLLRHQRGE